MFGKKHKVLKLKKIHSVCLFENDFFNGEKHKWNEKKEAISVNILY